MRKPKRAKGKDAAAGLRKRLASLGRARKAANPRAGKKAKRAPIARASTPSPRPSPRKRGEGAPAPSKRRARPAPAAAPPANAIAERLKGGLGTKVQPTLLPSQIKVGKRFRLPGPKKDAHIAALAASINERGGLIEPIAIDTDRKLIDGECRLLAWDKSTFAGQPIPVHFAAIDDLIAGEYDANAVRADFSPPELVAIKRAIEEKLGAAAKDRQRAGGKLKGTGRVRDVVATIGGKDGRTIDKAEKVVEAAERDPERFGKLVEDMTRTGRVDGPFKRLQNMERADALRAEPPGVPMHGPYRDIVIDFPWASEQDGDAEGRGYYPYPTMGLDEICEYARTQVRPIMHPDGCSVWLLIPNFHLVRGWHVRVLEALGLTASTMLTWCKPELGRGKRLRGTSEHAILGIAGDVPIVDVGQGTWFSAKTPDGKWHSAKAPELLAIIEKVTPASRHAYLFAGASLPESWDGHGDRVGAASAHTAAEKAQAKRSRKPKAKPDDADPAAWGGHAVTVTIDDSVDPPMSVGTCQCGETFRVPRDWTNPDEIMARGEELARLIAEHRKAVGADAKAKGGEHAASAPSPRVRGEGRGEGALPQSPLSTLELGNTSPPEDVLYFLDAVERGSVRSGDAAIAFARSCEWIKGRTNIQLTKFGVRHLARVRDLVRQKQAEAAADPSRRAASGGAPQDEAEQVEASASRPRSKPHRDVVVLPNTHAGLFKAMALVSDSAGDEAQGHFLVPEQAYGVITVNGEQFGLISIDVALGDLNEKDLKALCLGQDADAQPVMDRTPTLAAARALLMAFLEGWPALIGERELIAPMVRASDVRAAADAPVREGPHVLINAVTHAGLFEAFATISHDSGAGAAATEYPVPEAWAVVDGFTLVAINFALSCLDEQELTVFCIGEESEAQRLVERSPDLAAAHKLLAAFFDGWPAPAADDVTAPLRASRDRLRARFPDGVAGHVVTHTIDWNEPPHNVLTCACGWVLRVRRPIGAAPEENIAVAIAEDEACFAHWESVTAAPSETPAEAAE